MIAIAITNSIGMIGGNSMPAPVPLLLDIYPGATIAFSLRRLTYNYTGPCIRLRRWSDDAEMNFNFVNDVVDTASIMSFVGSSSASVVYWWNQMGGFNLTSISNVSQPVLVNSGVMNTRNGHPAMSFNGITQSLYATDFIAQSEYSNFATMSPNSTVLFSIPVSRAGWTVDANQTIRQDNSNFESVIYLQSGSLVVPSVGGIDSEGSVYVLNTYAVNYYYIKNSVNSTTSTYAIAEPLSASDTLFAIGSQAGSYNWNGFFMEYIEYVPYTIENNTIKSLIMEYYGV